MGERFCSKAYNYIITISAKFADVKKVGVAGRGGESTPAAGPLLMTPRWEGASHAFIPLTGGKCGHSQ